MNQPLIRQPGECSLSAISRRSTYRGTSVPAASGVGAVSLCHQQELAFPLRAGSAAFSLLIG